MQGVGWTIVMANCNNIFKDPETEIIKKNMIILMQSYCQNNPHIYLPIWPPYSTKILILNGKSFLTFPKGLFGSQQKGRDLPTYLKLICDDLKEIYLLRVLESASKCFAECCTNLFPFPPLLPCPFQRYLSSTILFKIL